MLLLLPGWCSVTDVVSLMVSHSRGVPDAVSRTLGYSCCVIGVTLLILCSSFCFADVDVLLMMLTDVSLLMLHYR